MLARHGWRTLIVMTIILGILLAMADDASFNGAIASAFEEPNWNTFIVKAGGQSHPIQYWITGGSVVDMVPNLETNSFTVTISSEADGKLTIRLPRELVDSRAGADGRSGEDNEFAVFVNEENVIPDEIETTSFTRTLAIDFDKGAETIVIVGTLTGMSVLSPIEWETAFIVGRFLNSDPPKADQIFKFQYRVTNGTVEKFEIVRELKGDVLSQGIDIEVNSSNNDVLETRIPRNFPYTNNPPGLPSDIDNFVFLPKGGGDIEHVRNTTECFFVFSVPVTNSIEMTLGMSSILIKSPYHGDEIPDECMPETVAGNVSTKPNGTIRPSHQVSAGVAPEDVLCPSGLELILNPKGKPYCATEPIIEFLNKVWFG